jgi:putative ABC transport system permease protein
MMDRLRQWLLRVFSVFRSAAAERDLSREIESHLALLEDAYVAKGMTRADARLAARRAFGGVDQAKERQRDARSFRWLDDLQRDARYAVRSLRRSPAFTAAAVLTLSIGIGATTAISSVVDTVLIRPLPLPDSDRLVRLSEPELNPRTMRGVNYNEYLEWRSRTQTLSAMIANTFNPQVMIQTREGMARLSASEVSANTFDALGVRAAHGRLIQASDEGNPDVMVLSQAAWRRYFRSEIDAVGSTIELRGNFSGQSNLGAAAGQGRLLTIIGVLPDSYDTLGLAFDFYTPLVRGSAGRNPGVTVRARLRDGVSLEAATEEANAIGNAIRPARPETEKPLTQPRFRLVRLVDELVAPIKPALQVFLVAAGVVLLIVCANVANLLLARGTSRARELAVRLAIGASRARLVRQILAECFVLATIGGTIGAAVGAAGINLVKQLATIDAQGVFRISFGGHLLPRIQEVGVDERVLFIAIALSILASMVFGVLPALHLSRVSQLQAMGTRGGGSTRAETHTRTALVLSQLVLATVLLVSAGLLVNSFINLSRVEKGYDPANALAFQLVLPPEYATERKAATIESIIAALKAKPAIEEAGFAYAGILLGIEDTVGTFTPAGGSYEEILADPIKPRIKALTHGYLKAMGTTLLGGRHLDARDDGAAPFVAVINRSVARKFFGEANPVGSIMVWRPGKIEGVPVEIVGVVEDVRQTRVERPSYPEVFMDYRQVMAVHQRMDMPKQRIEQISFGFMSFGVRTRGNPAAAIPVVRDVVRAADPLATIDAIHPMEEMVGYSTARQRFYAVLLGIFAGVAGVLAAIGIYGVLAYSVVQRTQEIGIRMALGAERAQVLALVMRRGVALAAIGISTGLIGAFAGARYLQSMLFGIEPRDPATFAAVAVVFAVVAAAAAYLPARRATRVDPMVALRVD